MASVRGGGAEARAGGSGGDAADGVSESGRAYAAELGSAAETDPTPVIKPVPATPAAKLNVGGLRLGKTASASSPVWWWRCSCSGCFRWCMRSGLWAMPIRWRGRWIRGSCRWMREGWPIRNWRRRRGSPTLLFPLRSSLRERYVAEADRVMADYREESESTPVNLRDWQQAAGSAWTRLRSRRKISRSAARAE